MIPKDEVSEKEFRQLLASAASGDEAALTRIAEIYGPDLLRVVRRKLPGRLRTVFDSQDFVQAMWATFIRHDIDPYQFQSPRELFGYLSGVAAHKVSEQIRKRLIAQKATLNREVPIESCREPVQRRRDTPSQIAIANESLDRLLAGQPQHYRQIVFLKASGASAADIADEIGMNPGSVRRVLRVLERACAAAEKRAVEP